MNAMHYKINLPADYTMEIIRKRVRDTGFKTDHFEHLLFKAYLISEKSAGELTNSYAPLYIWKQFDGMNQFIFDGFYDNIVQSFGWQNINIGIPYQINLSENFELATYALEATYSMEPSESLTEVRKQFERSIQKFPENQLGNISVYNPDKWKYSIFAFYAKKQISPAFNQYEVLHISKP